MTEGIAHEGSHVSKDTFSGSDCDSCDRLCPAYSSPLALDLRLFSLEWTLAAAADYGLRVLLVAGQADRQLEGPNQTHKSSFSFLFT